MLMKLYSIIGSSGNFIVTILFKLKLNTGCKNTIKNNMKEHYPFKSASYPCKRLKRGVLRQQAHLPCPVFSRLCSPAVPALEESVKMLRVSPAYDNIDDNRRSDNRSNCIQGDNTCFAGQDANQIAQQRHCPAAQNSYGQ